MFGGLRLFTGKKENTDSEDSEDSVKRFHKNVRDIDAILGKRTDSVNSEDLNQLGISSGSDKTSSTGNISVNSEDLNQLGISSGSDKTSSTGNMSLDSESVDSQIKKIMEELNAIQKKLNEAQNNNDLENLQKQIDKKYKDYDETVFKENKTFQENKQKLLEKIEYIKLAHGIDSEPQGVFTDLEQLINQADDNEKLEGIQEDINILYNTVVTQENNSVVKRNKQLKENKRTLLQKLRNLHQSKLV